MSEPMRFEFTRYYLSLDSSNEFTYSIKMPRSTQILSVDCVDGDIFLTVLECCGETTADKIIAIYPLCTVRTKSFGKFIGTFHKHGTTYGVFDQTVG